MSFLAIPILVNIFKHLSGLRGEYLTVNFFIYDSNDPVIIMNGSNLNYNISYSPVHIHTLSHTFSDNF